MSWCPFAKKMELQPESDSQVAIQPTQFILHSVTAPWSIERIYEYWRDSTNLESHFGLGYDGRLGQYIGTHTRADANAAANNRALSLESASNTGATDPWTDEQIETLVRVMDWAAREEGIPRRICRTDTDPGFGYHRQFASWNPNGHSCPGDARVRQFKEILMPRVIAGDVEVDVALTDAEIGKIADAVLTKLTSVEGLTKLLKRDGVLAAPPDTADHDTNQFWSWLSHVQGTTTTVRATASDVDEILARVKANGAILADVQKTLTGLDLSGLPDDIAAKLNGLRFKLEGEA